MTCPRCSSKMKCLAHRPHKQEKWRCPKCGKVRFKQQRGRPRDRRRIDT